MKVVIFCGGLGLRLREYSDNVPKPLVPIGDNPIIWHLMKYYSHYGHRDFVLCLGHKGESIKKFFLGYNEAFSSDFVMSDGGRNLQLLSTDFSKWRITFADTGSQSQIGERLWAVRDHLKDEDVFLANYVDGLSDLNLNQVINTFRRSGKIACFLSVPPTQSFHLVETEGSLVTRIRHAETSNTWINGGYFIFSNKIFDFMRQGEDLVNEPFQRLIDAGQLITVKHDGFWRCMDTFKERQQLEDLWSSGNAPWQIWSKRNLSDSDAETRLNNRESKAVGAVATF
ncbi:MAG: sugar phosphate nucleotidyltransferase [Terriglobales bacterium]